VLLCLRKYPSQHRVFVQKHFFIPLLFDELRF
jgi:hypothetical protein